MDKRILGIIIPVLVIIIVSLLFISPSSENTTQKNNENIGLVINSPSSSVSLQQLDKFLQMHLQLELVEVMFTFIGI